MKNFFLNSLLILSTSFCFSQNSVYQENYGGSAAETAQFSLLNPSDSSIFLFSTSKSNASGNKMATLKGNNFDTWVVKLDKHKNKLWDKSYGTSTYNLFKSAILLNNKIYMTCIPDSLNDMDKNTQIYGKEDVWLLCLNLDGDIEWQKSYGGTGFDRPYYFNTLTNGNLLITAHSSSPISGNRTELKKGLNDIWIFELNPSDGSIIQQRSIGTDYITKPLGTCVDNNGNIYVLAFADTGTSFDKTDPGYGSFDLWLVKLNSNFEILDDACFGGSGVEGENFSSYGMNDMIFDGENLVIATNSQSDASGNKTSPLYDVIPNNRDLWFLKIDTDLNLIWETTVGGIGLEDAKQIKTVGPEKNYFILAESESKNTGNKTTENFSNPAFFDGWLIYLSNSGEVIAQYAFGGEEYESAGWMLTLPNGNELISWTSNSNISGNKTTTSFGGTDIWLTEVTLNSILNQEELLSNSFLKLYPNPSRDFISISNPASEPVTIVDMLGKVVLTAKTSNSKIDISKLKSGVYLIKVGDRSQKLVVE